MGNKQRNNDVPEWKKVVEKPTLEKEIEKYLVNYARKKGMKAVKLSGQGNRTMPDRMLLAPAGYMLFVELKQKGKKPTPAQLKCHEELESMGFHVYVADDKETCKKIVDQMSHFLEEPDIALYPFL